MITNKTVLDEANRSVRRTFIGSIAGTITMMAVIGAAGAYGMPDQLSAKTLSVALTTLQMRFSNTAERAAPSLAKETASAVAVVPLPFVLPEPVAVVAAKPAPKSIKIAAVLARPFEPEPVATAGQNIERPWRFDAVPGQAELTEPPFTTAPVVTTVSLPEPESLSDREIVELPPQAPAEPAADPQTVPAPQAPATPAAAAPAAPPQEIHNTVEAPRPVMIALPRPKPPLTPAQRLDLHGRDYDKAERCLAQAVYFEARNEPAKGQEAVAQVVLNRVFSPYYPKDVCSVVYQNAHRYLSCQFTFACDGKSEAIRERGAWARASRIARQTLEAKIWLPEVNKATHYHAAYVHPRWVRDMRVMVRYGLHTFYRPRNWGDGSHEPKWGPVAVAAKKPAAPAHGAPQLKASHVHPPARSLRTRYWSRLRAARA